MLVINMFAGPGAGKSTTAAGLFWLMKLRNLNVELVTEYAKEKVWEGNLKCLEDQTYLIAKQNRRLERLRDKVNYVITDSPLLLGSYYGQQYGLHPDTTKHLGLELFETYKNINFFLERTKPYHPEGRLGSEEDAKQSDEGIREMLDECFVSYHIITAPSNYAELKVLFRRVLFSI